MCYGVPLFLQAKSGSAGLTKALSSVGTVDSNARGPVGTSRSFSFVGYGSRLQFPSEISKTADVCVCVSIAFVLHNLLNQMFTSLECRACWISCFCCSPQASGFQLQETRLDSILKPLRPQNPEALKQRGTEANEARNQPRKAPSLRSIQA